MDVSLLGYEEKAVFLLRSLYERYGYSVYKMSKFEEYELYVKNKDFLVSDRVITFNDTNGKLLALKPDVTLSIIKSGEDKKGVKQKVYYNENVYRISESTHRYKEIMQAGLECIGDIDLYDVYEVLILAAKSLQSISEDFVLEISHIGLLQSVIEKASPDLDFKRKVIKLVESKNRHDLSALCQEYGVSKICEEALLILVGSYGTRKEVLAKIEKVMGIDWEEIRILSDLLEESEFSDKIKLDFSVVGDVNYYNGFVFRGFVSGVCGSILSGGQYDNMMKKMSRSSKAVGFAVYLDRLEQMDEGVRKTVDTVLLYDEKTDKKFLIAEMGRLQREGSVSAEKELPTRILYKNVADIRGKKC